MLFIDNKISVFCILYSVCGCGGSSCGGVWVGGGDGCGVLEVVQARITLRSKPRMIIVTHHSHQHS